MLTSIGDYHEKQHNDKHKSWVIEHGDPWQKRGYNRGGEQCSFQMQQ